MSVMTEADRQLDIARDGVEMATQALAKIVVERCWGWDEYTDGARSIQTEAFYELLDIRNRIGERRYLKDDAD